MRRSFFEVQAPGSVARRSGGRTHYTAGRMLCAIHAVNNAVGAAAVSETIFSAEETATCQMAGGHRRASNYRTDTIVEAARRCDGISALNLQALGVQHDSGAKDAAEDAVLKGEFAGRTEKVLGIVQNVGDSHWAAFRRIPQRASSCYWQEVDSMERRNDGAFDTAEERKLRKHIRRNMDANDTQAPTVNSIAIFAGDQSAARVTAAIRTWKRKVTLNSEGAAPRL